MTPKLRLLFASLLLLAPTLTAQAALDDRERTDPTAWVIRRDVPQATIDGLVQQGFRITDIEVTQAAPTTLFTVCMVHNSGPYAALWWWYYNIDFATVGTLLSQNQARPIDLEPYDDGAGNLRFACLMVPNNGAGARPWWYLVTPNLQDLVNLQSSTGARCIDLNTAQVGATQWWSGVFTENLGPNARLWWWYVNTDVNSISQHIQTNGSQIYSLERYGANYNVILTVPANRALWWWYVGMPEGNVLSTLGNNGARPIDVDSFPGGGGTLHNLVMLNNSNELATRAGNLLRNNTDGAVGAYLKQVNGPVLAGLQQDRVFEPASSLKVLHHAHAMRAVSQLQVNLTTPLNVFLATSGSCPQPSNATSEPLQTVLRLMMQNSDNNRTEAVKAYFGQSSINATAQALGMTSTRLQHVLGCGGPLPNQLTLADAGRLHETIANGWLGAQRSTFYSLMLTSPDSYAGLGAAMAQWASSIGMSPALLTQFRASMEMASKGGSYTFLGPTREFRSVVAWVKLPFRQGLTLQPREYVTGAFVDAASNGANANTAINAAAVELLKDETIAAMRTWLGRGAFGTFGQACAGVNGIPTHTLTGQPVIGRTTSYNLANGPRSSAAILVVGFSASSWNGLRLPLSLGAAAPGCSILVDLIVTATAVTSLTGQAAIPLTHPNDRSLIGASAYTQYWCLDPLGTPLGLTFSNGGQTLLGDWY